METGSTTHNIRHRWIETLLNENVSDEGSTVAKNTTIVEVATQSPISTSSTTSSSDRPRMQTRPSRRQTSVRAS